MIVKSYLFKALFLSFLLNMVASPLQASALQKMFESLGGDVNVTTPGGFQDQAAGYYTGGGVVMRGRNKVVQPINISLPNANMGCGGIDMYFGAISAIKTEELVQLMRSMATGVPTYAFQLALKTMAPQLENLMSQIRKYVQDMNNTMLDSCQASQNLVGGLWPQNTAASEMICGDAMRQGGSDWFDARKHCRNKDRVSEKVEQARTLSPDLLQGEYNLTWHVLQKIPGYKEDADFAHFILTTVGTLISRKQPDGRFLVEMKAGKADQKDYLSAFLKGGQVTRYTCDETTRCLNPQSTQINIGEAETMKARTSRLIQSLWNKYRDNENILEVEKAFLNDAANLPVYRYIQVSAAVGSPFIMNDTSEYIAVSVLLSQFDRVSAEIISALESLQSIQLESETIENFKKNIQAMRGRLQVLSSSADGAAIWRLNKDIQAYEQALAARNN